MKNYKKQKGQGLVEYLIIVSFIAIAAITAMQFLGQNIRVKFTQISKELGGETSGVRTPKMEKGMTEKKSMKTIFKDSNE